MSGSSSPGNSFYGGLALGLVIGAAAVFIYYSFDDSGELTAADQYRLAQMHETNEGQDRHSHVTQSTTEERVEEPSDEQTSQTEEVKEAPTEETPIADEEAVPDSIAEIAVVDSLNADTVEALVVNDSLPDEIVIKRDELLAIRAIQVEFLQDTTATVEDSTTGNAAEVMGVAKTTTTNAYDTEFWSSPLNYKGYKMGKNKLLLYGIPQPDSVALLSDGEHVFLKVSEATYRLEITDEFRSFELAELPGKQE